MASSSSAWSSTSPSTSLVPGRSRSSATNSCLPVLKSSTTTTCTPSVLRRSARVLPMNPAPPVMHTRLMPLEGKTGGLGVAVEHLDRFQRELIQILSQEVEFLKQVVGQCDDVASNVVGLDDVQDLARGRPDQFTLTHDLLQKLDFLGKDLD